MSETMEASLNSLRLTLSNVRDTVSGTFSNGLFHPSSWPITGESREPRHAFHPPVQTFTQYVLDYRARYHSAAAKEKMRAAWRCLVMAELDRLLERYPTFYQRIPQFLAIPSNEIRGDDYMRCFYGKLNQGRNEESMAMARTMRPIGPKNGDAPGFEAFVGTPIEALVYALYPGISVPDEIILREFDGVTQAILKGWMQEHYREHHASIPVPEIDLEKEALEKLKREEMFRLACNQLTQYSLPRVRAEPLTS